MRKKLPEQSEVQYYPYQRMVQFSSVQFTTSAVRLFIAVIFSVRLRCNSKSKVVKSEVFERIAVVVWCDVGALWNIFQNYNWLN